MFESSAAVTSPQSASSVFRQSLSVDEHDNGSQIPRSLSVDFHRSVSEGKQFCRRGDFYNGLLEIPPKLTPQSDESEHPNLCIPSTTDCVAALVGANSPNDGQFSKVPKHEQMGTAAEIVVGADFAVRSQANCTVALVPSSSAASACHDNHYWGLTVLD